MSSSALSTIGRRLANRVSKARMLKLARRARWVMRTAVDAPGVWLENITGAKAPGIVILDDVFPSLMSGFRVAEYTAYLRAFPGTQIHSTAKGFPALGEKRSFAAVRAEYEAAFPDCAAAVRLYNKYRRIKSAGVFLMFVNNAARFLPILERDGAPFVFTLYPGGGFAMNDAGSDAMLRRVFASPCFRGVIVTQKVTRDYLIDGGFCPEARVHFIYGGVFPSEQLTSALPPRAVLGRDKQTFDVCFVAHRYMPGGKDKGYDTFLKAAHLLGARYPEMRFHVVGPWTQADGDVEQLGERLTFYGSRPTQFFPPFYARMDAILSPNVPFVLHPGSFDGFPTGACMEAGMCGVAVFCSDPLGLNVELEDGKHLVIVPPEAVACADAIARYRDDARKLAELSEAAAPAFRRVFGVEHQMSRRIALLKDMFGLNSTWSTQGVSQ